MWYVELLAKTYNAGDQTFYDAIKAEQGNQARISEKNAITIRAETAADFMLIDVVGKKAAVL